MTSYLLAGSRRSESSPQSRMAGLLKKVRLEVMICLSEEKNNDKICNTYKVMLFVLHCLMTYVRGGFTYSQFAV